jgi:GAF domain-containing protein
MAMKMFLRGKVKAAPESFGTHQERMSKLSAEMLTHYQAGLDSAVNDPKRLAEVYGSSFASASFKAQAHSVALMAASMLKTPHAQVNIITAEQQVSVAVAAGENPEPIDCGEGYCQNVIATGREFAVDNAREHALVCDTRIAIDGDVTSYLGVPIVANNYVIGVLCVYDTKPRTWGVVDVSMLTQLATVVTRAASAKA